MGVVSKPKKNSINGLLPLNCKDDAPYFKLTNRMNRERERERERESVCVCVCLI